MEKLKVSDVSGADFLRRFLEERGIDPDGAVARERGYAPYDKGDADAVYAALERTHPGYMENEAGRLNERWVDRFSRDTVAS